MTRTAFTTLFAVVMSSGCGDAVDSTSHDAPGAAIVVDSGPAAGDARVIAADSGPAAGDARVIDAGMDAAWPGTQPQPGSSFLTISGTQRLTLDDGEVTTLVVRFHNSNDVPLAGFVTFRMEGEAGESLLGGTSVPNNIDGYASVRITAGLRRTTFRVVAEAPHAAAVAWSVTISPREFARLDPFYLPITVGAPVTLRARRLSLSGVPLAGSEVRFRLVRLEGPQPDASLSATSVLTDANGIATTDVTLNSRSPSPVFWVEASADRGSSVSWELHAK